MATSFNRRSLLKKTGLLAGGYTFLPSFFNRLEARPNRFTEGASADATFVENAAYETTPPEVVARLIANENPFGPSDKAKKAVLEALDTSFRYPFDKAQKTVQKIADYEGVMPDQILTAAGSSPLLLAAALAYGKGTIVSATPSYEDLLGKAESFGTTVVRVPLTAEYKYDLDAMEKKIDAGTSLVYICNPNNPTATVIDAQILKAFCERVSKKTTVFIDEAYIDYLVDSKAASLMEAVRKGQNVIVARTFSKLYGFAGLRVGYAISSTANIKKLRAYTEGPLSVSATSWNAALAAYRDEAYLADALQKTIESKKYLYEVLKKEGYDYIPSSANFVLFPLKMDGPRFAAEMMKRGVGIRTWKVNGKDWCRVSIGRMEEMQVFAKAFGELS